MPRLRNKLTGVVVNVDDSAAARLVGFESADAKPEGYAAMTVVELKAAIKARNEGREEADCIPAEGNKADLIAALEADDKDDEPSNDE